MEGTYTTKRDGGLKYTYEAESGMQENNWHWSAKVRHANGQLAGTPRGVWLNAPSFVEDPVLQAVVEGAIEARAGVD